MTEVDAARCPLCDGPNRCAMAAGASACADCWCATVTIPADVSARVPAAARDVACICPPCAGAGPIAEQNRDRRQ